MLLDAAGAAKVAGAVIAPRANVAAASFRDVLRVSLVIIGSFQA